MNQVYPWRYDWALYLGFVGVSVTSAWPLSYFDVSEQQCRGLAFVINRSPKIDHLIIYFGIDFIQMPNRWGAFRPRPYPFCIGWAKLIDPPTNSFVGHINAAFDQKLFNISKAKIEPKVHPYGATDNVRMETMTSIDWCFHRVSLANYLKTGINVTKPLRLLHKSV